MRVAATIASLGCCALGAAAGLWLGAQRRAEALAAGPPSLPGQPHHPSPLALSQQSVRARSLPAEDLVAKVLGACSEKNPLRRAYELFTLLSPLDSPQLAALFARTVALED